MFEAQIASPLCGSSPSITPLAPISRAIVRCREADVAFVSRKLGIALPREACRSTRRGKLSALWLGPDEWLLLSNVATNGWPGALSTHLEGVPVSLVDVSHRQVAMIVQGMWAEDILAAGCALDLSIAAFPVGMCTRTMFAKAEIVLWRTHDDRFHLEVWRSFARYLEALLREVETEL